MAQAQISGTFSGTGTSDTWTAQKACVVLSFAGTATVSIDVHQAGSTWVVAESFTASDVFYWEPKASVPARLNCSAHTDNVAFTVYF